MKLCSAISLLCLNLSSETLAWTSYYPPKPSSLNYQSTLFATSPSNADRDDECTGSTRRQWLSNVVTAAASTGLFNILPANAAVEIPSSVALCDPTVSVWERNGRVIYLLGTAHISEISAELAGQLVRDTHPNAVFVELDLKRVGGTSTMAKQMETSGKQLSISTAGEEDSKPSRVMLSPVRTKESVLDATSTAVASSEVSTAAEPSKPKNSGGGGLLNNLGAAAVGRGIRGMYSKLGSEGFNPGEEFIVAIKEGQRQGAAIVLGDQDVDVTLRRMAQAIQKTDLSRLLNPDSELEQSMRAMLPASSGSTAGMSENEAFKTEMSAFVETMKTKENVKQIMALMQKEAPYLYQVMVQERDAYMAAGLNTLNEFAIITAVMGLAHLDGVERNLQSEGWKPVPVRCPQA